MNETNETEPMGEMVNKDAEIDPSMIEGIVGDTWDTYLGAAVEPHAGSDPPTESAAADENQVEARIRVSGDDAWEMTLRGSWSSAEEATRRMLGSSDQGGGAVGVTASTPEYVLDAWGELVNTLAGNLKASLDFGIHVLSIPEVFLLTPQVLSDQPPPEATQGISEYLFEWDGHAAMVRIARITLA